MGEEVNKTGLFMTFHTEAGTYGGTGSGHHVRVKSSYLIIPWLSFPRGLPPLGGGSAVDDLNLGIYLHWVI